MGRIRALFEQSKTPLFIPYLTVGDPTLEASVTFVTALARAGADVIELGVPYSDPVADGPTNMKAAERALKNGTSLTDVLGVAAQLRSQGLQTPLVLFTYYNPIFKLGHENFARLASKAGIDALLVVDLPPEEAQPLIDELAKKNVGTVFLASPTTPDERLKVIEKASSEFIYYVSRLGVTGAQTSLSGSLGDEVTRLKKLVHTPVAVGFGISSPEQAAEVGRVADAVVVGSAIVKLIEDYPDPKRASAAIEKLASALTKAAKGK